jgi:hypothetical protein
MVFLVPSITKKALASITAVATGTCGPEGQTHPCQFSLVGKSLDFGKWIGTPTESGTKVSWSTTGNEKAQHLVIEGLPGDEKGSVTYKVGEETAVLSFDNPMIGFNKCSISGIGGSCTAGSGYNDAVFKYDLRSPPGCKELKATIAEDELANSALWNME